MHSPDESDHHMVPLVVNLLVQCTCIPKNIVGDIYRVPGRSRQEHILKSSTNVTLFLEIQLTAWDGASPRDITLVW
jgi:hypothetical protein